MAFEKKMIFDHPLSKKITIVTIIKLCGLFLIWWLFFRESSDVNLTAEQVGNAILHPVNRSTTTH